MVVSAFFMLIFIKNYIFYQSFVIFYTMIRVKEFVARLGITQKDLAKKVGVKPETVYKWQAGTNKPVYDVIYQLKKMGMTDYELFGETFAEQEEFFRRRAMMAADRFLEDLGININKTKESL